MQLGILTDRTKETGSKSRAWAEQAPGIRGIIRGAGEEHKRENDILLAGPVAPPFLLLVIPHHIHPLILKIMGKTSLEVQ